jgi:hypothetical protein
LWLTDWLPLCDWTSSTIDFCLQNSISNVFSQSSLTKKGQKRPQKGTSPNFHLWAMMTSPWTSWIAMRRDGDALQVEIAMNAKECHRKTQCCLWGWNWITHEGFMCVMKCFGNPNGRRPQRQLRGWAVVSTCEQIRIFGIYRKSWYNSIVEFETAVLWSYRWQSQIVQYRHISYCTIMTRDNEKRKYFSIIVQE